MRYNFLLLFFLLGCPKSPDVSVVEKERAEALRELIEKDEEFFDDIPEADDVEEESKKD
tara:strand:- start:540 stop:716 length:177 start_codon:yes stop_codon:yes gene_type:complete